MKAKSKKSGKQSPKAIDYNKVAQKYGNLLDTSIENSDKKLIKKEANTEKDIFINNDSYYDYIIDNIYSNDCKSQKEKTNKNNITHQKSLSIKSNPNTSNIIHSVKSQQYKLGLNKKKDDIIKYKNKDSKNSVNSYNFETTKVNKSLTSKERSKKRKEKLVINIGNENRKKDANVKYKEKVLLLLNLCRKYANKFKKLLPMFHILTEKTGGQNLINELKKTIIQYNNMIYNEEIVKIFQLENNSTKINLINEYDNLSSKLKGMNEQLNKYKNLENKFKEQNELINELNQKIALLNMEIQNKDCVIKNLEIKFNREFESFNEDMNRRMKIKNNKWNLKFEEEKAKDNNYQDKRNYSKNNFDIQNSIPQILNNEIELLDQEILDLKSKLKNVIRK
jgi:hypothetical protein